MVQNRTNSSIALHPSACTSSENMHLHQLLFHITPRNGVERQHVSAARGEGGNKYSNYRQNSAYFERDLGINTYY